MLGLDPAELATIPVLVDELGIWQTIVMGYRLQKRERAGEPFEGLPAPRDAQERLSREQIGPAILLYDELRATRGADEALRITRRVVIEAAVAFLRQSIGPLRQEELERLDDAQREAFVHERGEKFFNASVTWDRIEADRVEFTVTHCHFPPLCAAAGYPELAPLFCAGDARFFGEVEPNVRLTRPHTIAEGASSCPFALQWVDE